MNQREKELRIMDERDVVVDVLLEINAIGDYATPDLYGSESYWEFKRKLKRALLEEYGFFLSETGDKNRQLKSEVRNLRFKLENSGK